MQCWSGLGNWKMLELHPDVKQGFLRSASALFVVLGLSYIGLMLFSLNRSQQKSGYGIVSRL